jgi:DNA-binding transcriptional MerR regulator
MRERKRPRFHNNSDASAFSKGDTMRFSIGEFSRITSLSIKTLRLYHEKGLLVPADVDKFTGYRYYNEMNFETARSIKILKDFDFTLAEIKEMVQDFDDEAELIPHLQDKLQEVEHKIQRYHDISRSLEDIIKEDGADYEPCFPVCKGTDADGIAVRELKGGRCVALIHKGPYETLRESYKKIFAYLNDKGLKSKLPSREVYLKGPGMIFRGNPKNFLTEIIIMIES